jgi:hypothetical protein
MGNITIRESEMDFGPFPEENVFRIESSDVYKGRLLPNGVKTCEFLLRRNNKLLFIEAKKTCPKQLEATSSEEQITKYNAYIHDITTKMRDSLNLYASMLLHRNEDDELSPPTKLESLENIDFVLVLVVKNSQRAWLAPFSDKLAKVLRSEMKIWGIQSFILLTEEQAREKRLVT